MKKLLLLYSIIFSCSSENVPLDCCAAPFPEIMIVGKYQVAINDIVVLKVVLNGIQNNNSSSFLWNSSDPTIAMVNSNGVVQGISKGEVIISVTTIDSLLYDALAIGVVESL